MKHLRLILAAAIVIASALTASAQFKFGPKVGVAVNSLHFDKSVFSSDNRAGFTGGLMCEFTAPVIGLGFDISAMYVRRTAQFSDYNSTYAPTADSYYTAGDANTAKAHNDYFTIPVNLKWKLSLPLVKPFITTGPEFSFLTSRKAITEAYRNKSVDYSWNFGLGVDIINHIQIHAQYGLGLNKALQKVGMADNATTVDAKNRFWTVTAAYLF